MTLSPVCRGIRQRRWPGVVAVCAAAAGASWGGAGGGGWARSPTAAAGPSVQAVGSPPASPVLGYRLNAVAALSAASAWAVGLSNQGTIHPIRWDGRSWQRVPAPAGGDLYGVAVLSAADAWAVGYGPSNEALIEHWNGTAWAPMAAPSTGGPAILHAGAAGSRGKVWAVGGATTAGQTGILRWDGTARTRANSPTPPAALSEFMGVAAAAASDAWAVGGRDVKRRGVPLMEHWNGAAWQQVTSPALKFGGILNGVAATSATNAWAVGNNIPAHGTAALIEHWNGTAWALVHSPALGGPRGLAGGTGPFGSTASAAVRNSHPPLQLQ